jgi:hypothetical protein
VAIDQDWQGNLASLTFGAATDVPFTGPIGGLGVPVPRTRDSERGAGHGDAGGDDVLPKRVLTLPLGCDGHADPAAAWDLLEQVKAAFAETIVDVPLDLRLPGMPTTGRRFYGRPRGLDADLTNLKSGWIDVLGTFDALDPFGYGDEDLVTGAGTFDVVNVGSAATDRVVLTITGNGGSPTGDTAADDGGDVSFAVALGGGEVRVVDLRAHTVVTGSGDDAYDELSPGSLWTVLQPGTNGLTLTGAASVDVALRPAFR